jgi:hypothetical protein
MSAWDVAHYVGCNDCKGTYFYKPKKSWDFLDTIMISKDRGVEFVKTSIEVFRTESNTYKNSDKPYRFDPITKNGVSDHFPMVAQIKIN